MDLPDIDPVLVGGVALSILVIVGAVSMLSSGERSGTVNATLEPAGAWINMSMADVQSGERFTVGQFDQPVLVETFAVWCPTCLRQQQEIKRLHDRVGDDIISVSIDTDQNEDAEKVQSHVQQHGFDWRYVVASTDLIVSLRDRFGASVLNPTIAPMIVVCPDGGATRLANGVKPAERLQQTVEAICG